MVPCYICRTPVVAGWICGPPPAADRYKLGLCRAHDTPVNRETVLAAWERTIQEELRAATAGLAQASAWHDVTVQFLDGGHLTFTCTSYHIDRDQDTLVCRVNDALEFIPLQHVRRIRAVPRQEGPEGAPERTTTTTTPPAAPIAPAASPPVALPSR
ncbi:hypothetical protein [Megalodesulfovibrio gigas]|uniref:Uncharacterized protein n=1 Tax=Megalodesulfovibrio gigas (strain ATCC 19364 / DSM 1382 / NCIMB 9332 / VKM B-1759) TaxID=1121448 RepID=T2G8D4_MEGG1|nr:hypothetical protein [Megalodesulfovibrio gigas]AGW12444.1 hypothetical protein DGI_0536 [Megalodesulfovibrio gigas DSM 1382 = ATCC 19364]